MPEGVYHLRCYAPLQWTFYGAAPACTERRGLLTQLRYPKSRPGPHNTLNNAPSN